MVNEVDEGSSDDEQGDFSSHSPFPHGPPPGMARVRVRAVIRTRIDHILRALGLVRFANGDSPSLTLFLLIENPLLDIRDYLCKSQMQTIGEKLTATSPTRYKVGLEEVSIFPTN